MQQPVLVRRPPFDLLGVDAHPGDEGAPGRSWAGWTRRSAVGRRERSCSDVESIAGPRLGHPDDADAWTVQYFAGRYDPYWRAVFIESLLRLMRDRPAVGAGAADASGMDAFAGE